MAPSVGPRLLIGIPAHNEELRVASIVTAAKQYGTVVVVDDGSTDLTARRAQEAGAIVIRFNRNAGKGAAVSVLFDEAKRLRAQVLVLIDGDGQHDPEEIPLVAAPCLNGLADVVIGSRYLSIKSDIPLHRGAGQRLFNWLTAAASGVGCSDSQSGFRAYGRLAQERMLLGEKTFSVESEQQFEIRRNQLVLVEVPISCDYAVPEKRSAWYQGMVVIRRLGAMTWNRRIRSRRIKSNAEFNDQVDDESKVKQMVFGAD